MIKINLLAEGKRPTAVRRAKSGDRGKLRQESLVQWLFVGTLLLCLAGFAVTHWLFWSRLKAKEKEIVAADREIAELKPIIEEVQQFKAKKQELEQKISTINELKANQRGPVHIMDEVSKALPELLWLRKLDMDATLVKINGLAFSYNALAAFIENLSRVPEFQEPELTDSKRDGDTYTFSLQFAYKPVVQGGAGAGLPAETPAAAPTGEAQTEPARGAGKPAG